MLDSVCHKKEIKSIEVPRIFTIGQIKEFSDLKWNSFLEANEKKLNITDIWSLVNLQRREWELKFLDIEKSMASEDYPRPSVAVAILSHKEEELDKMYMKVCTDGKTIERTIREYFYYKIGVPVVIVKIGSDICDASGTKEDIMRDFRRIYLKIVMWSHGSLWTLKELPCADTLSMLGSISIKRNKAGDLLIGLVASFDRHFNKFWTKQTIVSKKFLGDLKETNNRKLIKGKGSEKKNKPKGKDKKSKSKDWKDDVADEELTFQQFFEYKITNIFGKALVEFKERVCKLPVNIIMFVNEENCYYGSLYDKIFRSVIKKMVWNTNLIVIKSENANLSKNKMFFSFWNTIKDASGDTYKFQTQMHAPGFCIDRDLVMPISDKTKAMKNKRFHQFYLNPILGDINGKLDSWFIEKYNSDNMRLYKVVQYASEFSDQYRFADPEDIQILVYWLHFLDYSTILCKNKYRTKVYKSGGSKEGTAYISRHPMIVEYSDALIIAFEAGKFWDNRLKAQVLNKKAYEKDMENCELTNEVRILNTKIRSLATLQSIY